MRIAPLIMAVAVTALGVTSLRGQRADSRQQVVTPPASTVSAWEPRTYRRTSTGHVDAVTAPSPLHPPHPGPQWASPGSPPTPWPVPATQRQDPKAKEYAELRDSLHRAKDAEEREPMANQMRDLLNGVFEADLKQRSDELSELEQRVKKLRDALEHRRSSQKRIVDTQIEFALLSAEGLLFPGFRTRTSDAVFPVEADRRPALRDFAPIPSDTATEDFEHPPATNIPPPASRL